MSSIKTISLQIVITAAIVAGSYWYQHRQISQQLKSYAPVIIISKSSLGDFNTRDYYRVIAYFKQNGYVVLESSSVVGAPDFYYLEESEFKSILQRIK